MAASRGGSGARVLAFDVYGTLVDPIRVWTRLQAYAPERAVQIAELWRQKQLEYSFRLTAMERYQDFEWVTLAMIPLFLFSATFFPIDALPPVARWVVEVTPLYRGVVLCRELTTGAISWASLVSVVYLVALGVVGLAIARRRLDKLLLT